MHDITFEDKLTNSQTTQGDGDSVFPGENWFFYWKTSASLWRAKLENFVGKGKILIPINWSFHSETGDRIDFGEIRPETDLKKLLNTASEIDRELVFFIPLSPAPFLTNGGVPHFLARHLSIGPDSLLHTVVNAEGELIKLYSFFDTRVFQYYAKFCKVLGQYFSEQGVNADLYGLDCGHINRDGYQTFFYDRSKCYEQGLSRFLQTRQSSKAAVVEKINPSEENFLSLEFLKTIQALYVESARDALSANWAGTLSLAIIGASGEDFFNRLSHVELKEKYLVDCLQSLSQNAMPSLLMLHRSVCNGVLKTLMDDQVVDRYIANNLFNSITEENDAIALRPLRFFAIYSQKKINSEFWHQVGLWNALISDYGRCFLDGDLENLDDDFTSEDELDQTIFFFQGEDVDNSLFHKMLKIFMNGGRVVLSSTGMDIKYLRKLDSFFLENSLEVEKLNYHTEIHNISLGEGRLLILDGEKLTGLGQQTKVNFWRKILTTFNIRHLYVDYPRGIYSFWNTRVSNHTELNYEEIRRLDIYNPTSYKLKFRLPISQNYGLIKVVRKDLASFQTATKVLEVEMLPGGVLSLDFGVFDS